MKQNKYDDDVFFEKYGRMARSEQGLAAAGEWGAFEALMPPLEAKRVLDIGCGYGWHCIYAAQKGAASVLGTDISQKMLEAAAIKTPKQFNIEYKKVALEDFEPAPCSFDVVLSSLVFHYTADFEQVCKKVYSALCPGGEFLFTVEHPIFTARGEQAWITDENGTKLYWPVDNYFFEGARQAVFLGEHILKYHRTLTGYLNALLAAGFMLTGFVEPPPPENMLHIEGMKDELRRPMMLIIKVKK